MESILSIEPIALLGALAGGFLGAAFGGLVAFIFTGIAILIGIAVLIGSGDSSFLDLIGLGPFFGPHISFAGGVAAAAYAGRMGWIESGRDIATPLVSISRPSVLIVGALFGAFGYICLNVISSFGSLTDGIALTVVLSAVLARLLFGKSGIVGEHSEGKTGLAKFSICDKHSWMQYQDSFAMSSIVGLFVGAMSAWAAWVLLTAYPETPGVILLGFAVSATSLLFLGMNLLVPVTHHITLVSAVAVSTFMGSVTDGFTLILIGAFAGLCVAIVAQMFARFWLIRADTYIDPPASAIWPMTSVIILISAVLA